MRNGGRLVIKDRMNCELRNCGGEKLGPRISRIRLEIRVLRETECDDRVSEQETQRLPGRMESGTVEEGAK
jgi:hypothetical protein